MKTQLKDSFTQTGVLEPDDDQIVNNICIKINQNILNEKLVNKLVASLGNLFLYKIYTLFKYIKLN